MRSTRLLVVTGVTRGMIAGCVLSMLLMATQASAQQGTKGWLDASAGISAAGDDKFNTLWTSAPNSSGEVTSMATVYGAAGSTPMFDVGGGLVFGQFGVGVAFSHAKYDDVSAVVALSVPHPLIANLYASAGASTETLTRDENAFHISAAWVPSAEHFQVRLFGGPTYFSVATEAQTAVGFDQAWTLALANGVFAGDNAVEITDVITKTVNASTWGFHAGVDSAYFFNANIGIGGFVRYSKGNLTLPAEDTQLNKDATLGVGGIQAGGGLRIRF